ncbi:type III secretion system export apparatus subunit SctR [Herbaspirillum sp. YR522]|uniref:type III secretion system export apparatus subunit SctR n=1 Tax=Herbaspirillum sp. YR522 TaxID=1144342 RepID=UPI00026FC504|nr:type III secretion system export apparatus subunit SctR [Herbaspirillum sp. YR522]EJN02575.1 type III secretion apparatus protein, YscR/HrcR family [Herbaspirillum sp. YR522]
MNLDTPSDHINIIALYVALGLLPLAMVMLTSFTKISIVLSLLRNALGVQQVPSNLVIAGLSLAATFVIMQPVGQEIASRVDLDQTLRGRKPLSVALIIEQAGDPVKKFLHTNAKPSERDFFAKALRSQRGEANIDEMSFSVLIPAFVISEIGAAFEIGFLLYLVFAIVDLVVANVLMAMGMTMFAPTVISIPLKLLVFVAASGLPRLMHSLVLSYTT